MRGTPEVHPMSFVTLSLALLSDLYWLWYAFEGRAGADRNVRKTTSLENDYAVGGWDIGPVQVII